MKPFGSCGCLTLCRQYSCAKAKMHTFCAPNCCPHSGKCGNGLTQFEGLMLVKDIKKRSLAIITTKPVPMGVVLGQYLGRLTLEPPRTERVPNSGYRLIMSAGPSTCGQWR
jgi:hypothetical protein